MSFDLLFYNILPDIFRQRIHSGDSDIVENDIMKTIWKDEFDFDNLSIDFSIFNKHVVPNVDQEKENDYFWLPLFDYGLNDWIWRSINYPNKD